MPNAESLAALAQLKLIQTTDDDRAAGDAFKLPAVLRTQVDRDFTKLDEADAVTAATEGDRAGGSGTARTALTNLAELLHEAINSSMRSGGRRSRTRSDGPSLRPTAGWVEIWAVSAMHG